MCIWMFVLLNGVWEFIVRIDNYISGAYFSFSSINIISSKRKRATMWPSAKHTQNSTFAASTDGSSNYDSSDMSTALMEQLCSLSVRMLHTQLKRCSLPTLATRWRWQLLCIIIFTPPKAHQLWIPTMPWCYPKTQKENNNKQEKSAHQLEQLVFSVIC